MPSIHPEDLTPFGRVAVKLSQELADLALAGEQIAGVNLHSDRGLDDGIKILNRVALSGESVAATMQEFAASLQEARDRADAAIKLVSERAQVIQQRRQQQDQLQEKLNQLKAAVKEAGASLACFAQPASGAPSEEDKRRIAVELERIQAPMTRFIEAAQTIKAEAARSNFTRLERQADSIIDSLNASRRKIAQAVGSQSGGSEG